MSANPDPNDDDNRLDAYDLQWVIIYALLAWAVTCGLTVASLVSHS